MKVGGGQKAGDRGDRTEDINDTIPRPSVFRILAKIQNKCTSDDGHDGGGWVPFSEYASFSPSFPRTRGKDTKLNLQSYKGWLMGKISWFDCIVRVMFFC